MVMDMLDMSVTLIVKAPNQQIEDQTIKCEPTWTIKKLKGHLSEVYPSKPRTEDQKLIYSGQLLPDSVILRDILRWYEGQEAHTLHLVCAPPRDRRTGIRQLPRMSDKRSSSAAGENVVNTSTSVTDSMEGLRHRLSPTDTSGTPTFVTSSPSGQFRAPDPAATWAAALAQPYTAGYDPNSMVQQLAMMQQAYAHYMTQYMQMLASGASPQGPILRLPEVNIPPQTPEEDEPEVDNEVPEPEPAVAVVAAENNNANNLLEGEDEARGNRDWLDWFYFMSRLMVLFSIVYFYSSPTRFVIVAVLGVLMYLYQVGFFRIQLQQQQRVEVERVVPDNNNVAVDNNNTEHNEDEVQEQPRAAPSTSGEAQVPEPEPDRPSLLAITWTFFTSFFASLIPEQPGAI